MSSSFVAKTKSTILGMADEKISYAQQNFMRVIVFLFRGKKKQRFKIEAAEKWYRRVNMSAL